MNLLIKSRFFISGNGGYRPSQIYFIFLYVLAYYVIGKIVTQFVSVLYSFRFIAWAICQLETIPIINNIVFSPIFIFLDIFSKPNFSYMITYVKAHHFVVYKFIGWRGGGKSPLICEIFRPHFQAGAKVYGWQSGIGLIYWTYILRI